MAMVKWRSMPYVHKTYIFACKGVKSVSGLFAQNLLQSNMTRMDSL